MSRLKLCPRPVYDKTYDKQLVILLDEEQQTVVGRLVLAQLLGVRQADGGRLMMVNVISARWHGRRPVGRDRAGRSGTGAPVVRPRVVAEVEQRRGQAHGQVARRHLVHVAPGRHPGQKVQQRVQGLAVFVRQQQYSTVDGFLLQVHRDVCTVIHIDKSTDNYSSIGFKVNYYLLAMTPLRIGVDTTLFFFKNRVSWFWNFDQGWDEISKNISSLESKIINHNLFR